MEKNLLFIWRPVHLKNNSMMMLFVNGKCKHIQRKQFKSQSHLFIQNKHSNSFQKT